MLNSVFILRGKKVGRKWVLFPPSFFCGPEGWTLDVLPGGKKKKMQMQMK